MNTPIMAEIPLVTAIAQTRGYWFSVYDVFCQLMNKIKSYKQFILNQW